MKFIKYKERDAVNLEIVAGICKRNSKDNANLFFILFPVPSESIWWNFDNLQERNDVYDGLINLFVANNLDEIANKYSDFEKLFDD